MSVTGEWLGDMVKGRMRDAAGNGLLAAAERVRSRSEALAPREFGELVGSATADVDRGTLIAAVSYDVARFPKAYKQHEDLSYNHPGGGQAKFLEQPVMESGGIVQSEVARAVDRALR